MKVSLPTKLFLFAAALAVGILDETRACSQPGGVPLWTNRFAGQFSGLAVDRRGNVIVAGGDATIKYSAAGVPLWTNRPGGAVAVDGNGNVVVSGSGTTIKYSVAGVPLWTNLNIGGRVALDDSGNVFVTGTIKYSADGVPLWTNAFDGYNKALAVDGSGNVVVTGMSQGAASGFDYATIKYSSGGVALWTNRYNGPGNYVDVANAVAVDRSGNVFVTGYSFGSDSAGDYATIKYSSDGVPLWTNRFGGAANPNNDDEAVGVAVDGSGNVFVTGYSYGLATSSSYDYATIKYSGAGVPLWTNRYNDFYDQATALAVDAAGNVVVTGSSSNSHLFGVIYATIEYSNAGVPLWTNYYKEPGQIGGPGSGATAVAVDASGNVVVTGRSYGSSSGDDVVTIKYSSVGGPLLGIARTATNTLAFSWPSPAADFILQENTNVASTNWSAVSTTPADDGTNKTVIIDPPEGNKFYRLFRP